MPYIKLSPNIHIISQPLDRKKFQIEATYMVGGSLLEEDRDRGRTHLLEHCIVSRTKNMDFESFNQYQFENNIIDAADF